MKQYLFLLLLIAIVGTRSLGQCSSVFIELNTQAQVDDFLINYGDYDTIFNCIIGPSADISKLDSLQNAKVILQDLQIQSVTFLNDLTGLQNLNVGRDLTIRENPALTDLSGLGHIEAVEQNVFITEK